MMPAKIEVALFMALALAAGCSDTGRDETGSAGATAPVEQELDRRLLPAMQLAADGRAEEARSLIAAYAAEPDALAYQATFLLGFVDHRRKAYAAAREQFEAAARLQPDYHPSWHFLGFACHALGDLPAARAAWEQHRRLQPGEGDDWFGLGLIAFEEDDLSAAEHDLREALRLFQQDAAAGSERGRELGKTHARLADLHARRGNWPAARDALEASVSEFTGSDEVWHKLYQAHVRLGDDERAGQAKAMRDRVRELR